MKATVSLGWLLVFSEWLVGVHRDRAPIREAVANRWHCRLYGIVAAMVLGCILVDDGPPRPPTWRKYVLVPYWLGVGLYFWSRLSLRSNWSSEARIAENHYLVTSGAYRLVRHPIYLSKVLMAVASGFIMGNRRVLGLSMLLTATGIYQARIEDGLLRGHFGDAHAAYVRRTGMLVPRLPLDRLSQASVPLRKIWRTPPFVRAIHRRGQSIDGAPQL